MNPAREARIQAYQYALQAPAWADTIRPEIKARRDQRINAMIEACVSERSTEHIRALGTEIATLNWVMTWMERAVAQWNKEKRDEKDAEAQAAAAEVVDPAEAHTLRYGRGSPFIPPVGQPDQTDGEP